MRVVVFGASGYLGRAVGDELVGRGHDVLGVSRSARASVHLRAGGTTARCDLVTATDAELDALLGGASAAVWCLGPDDRSPLPAPVAATLDRLLVQPTVRAAAAARRAGLARFVILGSYFATFHRLHPAWDLAGRHPYIAARLAQTEGAEAAAPGLVSVLEIPFVFGPVEGTVSLWKPLLFEPLRRSPVGFAPSGGSAAVTATDVARAVSAVVEGAAPAGRYPLGVDNISYRRLAHLVLDELGRSGRPVLPLPALVVTAGAMSAGAVHRLRGRGSGLDGRHVAGDVVARRLHLDPDTCCRPLGLEPSSIEDAVRATVRAAYPERVADQEIDPGRE